MTCIIFFLQLSCCRRHKARAKKKRYQRREKKRKVEALNWMCVTCDSTGCFFSNDEDSNQKWRSVVNNFVFAFPRSTTCFAKPLLNHWCRNTLSWNGSNNDDKKKKSQRLVAHTYVLNARFTQAYMNTSVCLCRVLAGNAHYALHTQYVRESILFMRNDRNARTIIISLLFVFLSSTSNAHNECE